ncbi:LysM peptidoglycan-binding domain-containing protein [Sulfurovum sp. ST-21]|uniref:LysM peptidoglycan-binding domain-containing protein n=1 Tax=Sulfurovum indicum TaxID=2779528 RepID=A0A7M1S4U6_9BACT|nr:C40 family peptidase [Sulfurovum indicum]QOR62021.1 LysM peptidoglycan-binding domain-containing protein [Sulfurovum indicum]
MKRLYKLLLPLSIATVTSYAANTTVKHTVKSGESLYTIAKKNHTTIDALCKINGIKKDEILKVGRAIKVPTASSNTKAANRTAKHTVKSGESLYTIAKKNHTTIDALCKINGIKKDEILKLGRVIKVPTASSNTKAKRKTAQKSNQKKKHLAQKSRTNKKYVIRKGDTLSTLAKKHHTTVAALRKANRLKKGQILRLGQVLTIPGKTAAYKKKIKIAKHKPKAQEKKLAKTLTRLKSKRLASTRVKKPKKYTLNDIVFGKSSKHKEKLPAKSRKIISLAKKKLGKRYVWGAVGQKNTFDCSGLTSYVCKANGINIPRRAIEQSKYGKPVKRNELQPGDLVFFDTSKKRKGYVNHVGIYIGNNKFIHASSAKKKVVITSLKKPFYSQRFKGARRVASL